MLARALVLGQRRHRVLEVEEHLVGRQALRLAEHLRVRCPARPGRTAAAATVGCGWAGSCCSAAVTASRLPTGHSSRDRRLHVLAAGGDDDAQPEQQQAGGGQRGQRRRLASRPPRSARRPATSNRSASDTTVGLVDRSTRLNTEWPSSWAPTVSATSCSQVLPSYPPSSHPADEAGARAARRPRSSSRRGVRRRGHRPAHLGAGDRVSAAKTPPSRASRSPTRARGSSEKSTPVSTTTATSESAMPEPGPPRDVVPRSPGRSARPRPAGCATIAVADATEV